MMIIGRRTNVPFVDYVEQLDHENRRVPYHPSLVTLAECLLSRIQHSPIVHSWFPAR